MANQEIKNHNFTLAKLESFDGKYVRFKSSSIQRSVGLNKQDAIVVAKSLGVKPEDLK